MRVGITVRITPNRAATASARTGSVTRSTGAVGTFPGPMAGMAAGVTGVRVAVGDGFVRRGDLHFQLDAALVFPVPLFDGRLGVSDIVESEESELADELVLDDGTALEESGDEFLLIHVLVKISHEHFAAFLNLGELDSWIVAINDLFGKVAERLATSVGFFEVNEPKIGFDVDFLDFAKGLNDFGYFFRRRPLF